MIRIAAMQKHWLALALMVALGWFSLATAVPAAETARLPSGVALSLDLPLRQLSSAELRGTGLASVFKGRDEKGVEFALVEIELPWHVSWVFKLFPELSMEFAEEHIQAGLRKQLGLGPDAPVTTALEQKSGFPSVFFEIARSSAQSPASDTSEPAEDFRAAQLLAGDVLLIDGRFAIVACWSRSSTQELPVQIFDAIQMPYEREQGDAEAQFRVVCVGSGLLVLAALGLVLACIVVIDKSLRKRKLQRMAHG
ncbi:MAG: hypothetical protein ACK41V_19525 [Acidovorax sp.]|uniref:hypothetical protein n=1 Tax=Acidovorax sp. TaxID=1872122 RepID=UPI0039191E7F